MRPPPFPLVVAAIQIAAALPTVLFAAEPPPSEQRQYAHPEAPYTEDFAWKSVNLTGLQAPGALLEWTQPTSAEVHLTYERLQAVVTAPVDGVLLLQIFDSATAFDWPQEFPIGILPAKFKPAPLLVLESAGSVEISGNGLRLTLPRREFSATLSTPEGETLLHWRDLHSGTAPQGLRSFSRFELTPDDHFFGLGGKSSPLDRRGTLADIYSVKVETKRGDYGGFAMPYFLNPRGYGFILNNPFPRVFFDFGYESERDWSLTTPDGPIDVFFLSGQTPQRISQRYHALTGAPAIPPKFMLGLWVSWFSEANDQQWLEYMQRFRDEKWPADMVVLDLFWRGGMAILNEGGQGKNLDWDTANFGDGPRFVKALNDMHLQLALHVNTRMFADPLLTEGLDLGFLRRSGHQQVVSVLNTPAARDWNWSLYEPRVKEGTTAWWVDNGERVDGQLGSGLPSRNLYGEVWNRFLFDRMEAAGLENRLVLARGGWLGTQTNATPWPGDTGPGVERQREDLWFVGNLAMSGVPYTGVDLGGFKADGLGREIMHSDENIIRRVAHGFLIYPVPRLHNTYRAPPKFPWLYNEKVQAVYRRYLELRYALFPYYYSAAVESSRSSVPMVRPLAFDHFRNERTYTIDDELLVGPSLLVAPVMETSAHSRYVYLPAGEWFDYWTGESFAGNRQVLADAPLYRPHGLPIFVRKGAIIPSRPPAQFNQDAPEPKIHLDLYPAKSGNYQLWENETESSPISYVMTGQTLVLKLANNSPIPRRYTVACRDGRAIVSGYIADRPVSCSDGVAQIEVGPKTTITARLSLSDNR
ncbi:MAG: glycoside hydrolase family 31 protein [Cephaloticoccus sp.]